MDTAIGTPIVIPAGQVAIVHHYQGEWPQSTSQMTRGLRLDAPDVQMLWTNASAGDAGDPENDFAVFLGPYASDTEVRFTLVVDDASSGQGSSFQHLELPSSSAAVLHQDVLFPRWVLAWRVPAGMLAWYGEGGWSDPTGHTYDGTTNLPYGQDVEPLYFAWTDVVVLGASAGTGSHAPADSSFGSVRAYAVDDLVHVRRSVSQHAAPSAPTSSGVASASSVFVDASTPYGNIQRYAVSAVPFDGEDVKEGFGATWPWQVERMVHGAPSNPFGLQEQTPLPVDSLVAWVTFTWGIDFNQPDKDQFLANFGNGGGGG